MSLIHYHNTVEGEQQLEIGVVKAIL